MLEFLHEKVSKQCLATKMQVTKREGSVRKEKLNMCMW